MDGISEQALAALAAGGRRASEEESLEGALRALGDAAAEASGADVVVIRIADEAGRLGVHTVASRSEALAAELAGSAFSAEELARADDELPEAVLRAARRARAGGILLFPAGPEEHPLGSVELFWSRRGFTPQEAASARIAAAQLGLALRAFLGVNGARTDGAARDRTLTLSGDALAAGLDEARAGDEIVRVAAQAADADGALLWYPLSDGALEVFASAGLTDGAPAGAADFARRALADEDPVRLDQAGGAELATLALGRPPVGVLQLLFPSGSPPSERELDRLTAFAVRAAQALRAVERAAEASLELGRAQAMLEVMGQALAELSLAHTLETAVARVTEIVQGERVVVYLREGAVLRRAAGPEAGDQEHALAERLLEIAFGPLRAQGLLFVPDARFDPRLASVGGAVGELEVESLLAVPLVAREELIGLLVAYLPEGREPTGNESALLIALASQLAVAVQNAQLHERTARLAVERERALAAERSSASRLRALYEISRSFAQSLSLEVTLDAVTRAAVELLDADAAVVRMEDERGDQLVPRASYVADSKLAEPLKPLLTRDQSVENLPGRRLFRMGRPLVLDPTSARRLGFSYELLVPFLEQGSTAVVVPIATPAELLATLTVVSLDPERRIDDEGLTTAMFVAGQAALAIDNARLYQQQKDFADTMQRSLLPRGVPMVSGLEVGAVYESSARVEVGGDVYDFLALPDGRLAVVLGDASGHGIAATADMALAKFAFRSLVRLYPDPGELLARANEVAYGELAGGTFITMVCVTVDPAEGELDVATAGHPPPRLVGHDGSVAALAARGLALGIEPDQRYEGVSASLPPGGALCLYTDGLVEARRDAELYGEERLDAALAAGRGLSAQALAEHVVADCRAFAGEPDDDYTVVVIRRGG